jgi:hypothetical protein
MDAIDLQNFENYYLSPIVLYTYEAVASVSESAWFGAAMFGLGD